jgi:hypothetical protein
MKLEPMTIEVKVLERPVTAEELAKMHHAAYEELNPWVVVADKWADVSAADKALLVATAARVIEELARPSIVDP